MQIGQGHETGLVRTWDSNAVKKCNNFDAWWNCDINPVSCICNSSCIHLIYLDFYFRVTSLEPGQSYDCPSASEVTLNDMGKFYKYQTSIKYSKMRTVHNCYNILQKTWIVSPAACKPCLEPLLVFISDWASLTLRSTLINIKITITEENVLLLIISWARFLSLARGKLRLCSANHRPGYWSNLPCDWPSTAWAYSEQETENGPSYCTLPLDVP